MAVPLPTPDPKTVKKVRVVKVVVVRAEAKDTLRIHHSAVVITTSGGELPRGSACSLSAAHGKTRLAPDQKKIET